MLIISHEEIGRALIQTVIQTLGSSPLPVEILSVPKECYPEALAEHARKAAASLDHDAGVLVLTDMYGATPSNIALRLTGAKVRIVTGLNLPMLMRVLNYSQLGLDQLAEKAVSGGREGVFLVARET
ncbi:MAG TPA: PTS fructose transporter subunit IIA [Gammaproteobacteria bacterium]|nr:PTS fructose transporter subunit IIA [Gammaproteobacteria bacterium]